MLERASSWTWSHPDPRSGYPGSVLVGHDEAVVSLGKSHGVGRRRWAVPCRLQGSGAMEPAEGDEIDPEFVALDRFRGENRPPWDISRHPREGMPRIGSRVTGPPSGLSPSGRSNTRVSRRVLRAKTWASAIVAIGALRDTPAMECPEGERFRASGFSLGMLNDAGCRPWHVSRLVTSPLGRSVPPARSGCNGTRRG